MSPLNVAAYYNQTSVKISSKKKYFVFLVRKFCIVCAEVTTSEDHMSDNLPAITPPTLPSFEELGTLEKIANSVAKTSFVPRAYQGKPGDIFAAALYGREFGWSLMVSLQQINVIQGKPTMSAEAMVALIRKLGHSIETVEWTDTVCTLKGRHAYTGDEGIVSFSMQDAERAGLKGDNWRKYPKAMLRARATTMLARSLFADAILGISYTPEELGGNSDAAAAAPPVVGAVEVVRRRKRGTSGVRCGMCDGYGADDDGVECASCAGSGVPQRGTTQPSVEYEPVTDTFDSELGELLDAKSERTPWELIQARDAETIAGMTRDYEHGATANLPNAPLSIDVAGHLCYAMGDAGRAASIEEACDKLAEAIADNPTVTNAWAISLAERMTPPRVNV